jgi:hypothetical protein
MDFLFTFAPQATAGYIRTYREMWDMPDESEVRGGCDMSSELPMEPMAPKGYSDFLMEVKTQIRQRQLQALRAVNSELLALYWWLGENIGQRQNAMGWGKSVVENLARDLQAEFPGRNGFSVKTCGACASFTTNTVTSQNSNR